MMTLRQEAEQFTGETGLVLPEVLIVLYEARGNGGFGPDYGLLGICNGHTTDLGDTMLSLYQRFCETDPDDPDWVWPRHLIPFIDIGCAIHLCLDTSDPNYKIIEFDPDFYRPGSDLHQYFREIFPSFEAWLAEALIQD